MLRIATVQDVITVLCSYLVGFGGLIAVVLSLPSGFCWMHMVWVIVFFLYVISGPGFFDSRIKGALERSRRERERLKLDCVKW
jgi:hypothetical protein